MVGYTIWVQPGGEKEGRREEQRLRNGVVFVRVLSVSEMPSFRGRAGVSHGRLVPSRHQPPCKVRVTANAQAYEICLVVREHPDRRSHMIGNELHKVVGVLTKLGRVE